MVGLCGVYCSGRQRSENTVTDSSRVEQRVKPRAANFGLEARDIYRWQYDIAMCSSCCC
jgi:hypothetical protein